MIRLVKRILSSMKLLKTRKLIYKCNYYYKANCNILIKEYMNLRVKKLLEYQ